MPQDPYLFPTGAIREVEKKLFDANDLERMVDAENVDKAFKIFNELSYADELLDMESPAQYKEVLAHDLGQVKNFLATIIPEPELLDFILARFDFHNLKVLFKAKFLSRNPGKAGSPETNSMGLEKVKNLSPLGIVKPETLEEIIVKSNTKLTLPDPLHQMVNEALKDLEKNKEPQKIDVYFEKKYFAYLFIKLETIPSEYLTNLVKTQIDLANIKITLRSKLLDKALEEFRQNLIPRGNLNLNALTEAYNKDIAGIIKTSQKAFDEAEIINDLGKFLENQELWQLEKALENYLLRQIKKAHYIAHGPEVIVAYFLAKKNAIRNIRLIMTGKINQIEVREIKEKVKQLY